MGVLRVKFPDYFISLLVDIGRRFQYSRGSLAWLSASTQYLLLAVQFSLALCLSTLWRSFQYKKNLTFRAENTIMLTQNWLTDLPAYVTFGLAKTVICLNKQKYCTNNCHTILWWGRGWVLTRDSWVGRRVRPGGTPLRCCSAWWGPPAPPPSLPGGTSGTPPPARHRARVCQNNMLNHQN